MQAPNKKKPHNTKKRRERIFCTPEFSPNKSKAIGLMLAKVGALIQYHRGSQGNLERKRKL